MSRANQLQKKLTRREKAIQKHAKNKDRIDLAVKVMEKGRGVKALVRGEQRRYDKAFGQDMVAKKPIAGVVDLTVTIDRFDYGSGDFGIRVTFPSAAIESWAAPQVGDVVKIRSGKFATRELAVVAVTDSTHIRLEDDPNFATPGVAEQTQILTVADVAGSLNNSFFDINSALNANLYYVWYDNGSGVDPAPGGRSPIHVVYVNNATAATIASLTAAAIAAIGGATKFSTTAAGNQVLATNKATGAATDAVDGSAPTGFAISVVRQGVTAVNTASEAGDIINLYNSTEKKATLHP